MTKERTLTLKFVYAAQDAERMEQLSCAVAQEVLSTNSFVPGQDTAGRLEMTFGVVTPLKLADAYLVVEDMVREKEDVVMTSISLPDEDLITVIHRNSIVKKAAELAP